MNTKTIKLLLAVILLVAAIMRLWKLDVIPPHLTPDEAALGYNAYSILKTGRDEYGQILPLIFKSFGDYKPGLYIYLTVPFVVVFGLTELAVRLPSALAGILAVYLVFLIVKEFIVLEKLEIRNLKLEIIASFMLAISPWHIHFSRGAWEANVSLTLTLAGIYFLLKSFRNSKLLILASIFFSSTLLTYQGAKLSTTVVVLTLVVIFWTEVKVMLKGHAVTVIHSMIAGLIILLPIIFSLFQGKTGRLTVFSVFSYPRPQEYLQTFLDEGKEKVGDFTYYLFHSEKLNFTRGVMGRWFNHVGGRFLFFEGDYQNPRHSAPNHGMLLLVDLILLPVGLFAMVKFKSKLSGFIFLWLIFAPLPAVLSRDQVHAVRALNMVIPLTIISGFGLTWFMERLKTFRVKAVSIAFCCFLVLLFFSSFVYYLDSYFIHLPKHDSKIWDYGYKQIVETVTPIQTDYKTVKVQQSFAQPYIYFLFFQKYDPSKYQKQAKLIESEYKGDVGYVTKLDNIEFVPIDWSVNRGDRGTLIIGDTIRIPESDSQDPSLFNKISEIKYLNGETAFRIMEVK